MMTVACSKSKVFVTEALKVRASKGHLILRKALYGWYKKTPHLLHVGVVELQANHFGLYVHGGK